MKKKRISTIIIVLIVILIAVWAMNKPVPTTTEEIAKCIGENSIIYVNLGCHSCEEQEDLFGKYYQHLNIIDCFFDREACGEKEISGTPTWFIEGERYVGVQSIEKLKELTGC